MLLSVIIATYNSRHVLEDCLKLLKKRLQENNLTDQTEIIVVDNNSQPEEQKWLRKISGIKLIQLEENIGFGRANNLGIEAAKGKYVLFLNSDVNLDQPINLTELFTFLSLPERAGLTVKVVLPDGQIDPASHRGFPTPGNALAYFSGLEKLTRNRPSLNKWFGGYHLTHLPLNSVHQIDSPTAAFFLVKKLVLDELGGFDPDYFFYGEDLDLAFRIKKAGYTIWYYPQFTVTHLKYKSSQKSADQKVRQQTRRHFFTTMNTFVDKHYSSRYPKWLLRLTKLGINTLAKLKY